MGRYRNMIRIGGAAVGVTLLSLFAYLQILGMEFTDVTGDINCAGTDAEPCVSKFLARNRAAQHMDIYNTEQVLLSFSPAIKEYRLGIQDGSCKVRKDGTLSKSSTGVACLVVGYRYLNFTDETKPKQDRVYVHRFSRYSTKEMILIGFKFRPDDVVKWSVSGLGDVLDPVWRGPPLTSDLIVDCVDKAFFYEDSFEVEECVDITIFDEKLAFDVCLVMGATQNGTPQCSVFANNLVPRNVSVCTSVLKTVFFNETVCVSDGIVRIGSEEFGGDGLWCGKKDGVPLRFDCITGVQHDAYSPETFVGCQDEGGHDCVIYKCNVNGFCDVSRVDSEKYVKGVTASLRRSIMSVLVS